ncbi:DUF4429 domain-containing protein [Nocardiopsis potens]|uniref:DUF4429 domain-containing protein n=1 Tax=Nocardiopsis potens TaxID=1246458 RepID=UPI000344C5A1|nr:DUF4429 domain-containing protein [Nocardiopsis potens]
MENLRGKQGTWTFDEDKVVIDYATGWLASSLNKALARTEVPLRSVAGVDFRTRGTGAKKKGWEMRLRIRDQADPFAAVGAAMSGEDPFLLSGDAKTELVAEYHADQLRLLAERAAAQGPPPAGAPARLVAPLPLHIQVHEGTAAFDGSSLVLSWTSEAAKEKRSAQRREFPLERIAKVEWNPSDGWDYGVLRVLSEDGAPRKKPVPAKRDLSCLLFDEGGEQAQALLMAATVTAHLWAAGSGRPEADGAAAALPSGGAVPAIGAGGGSEEAAAAGSDDDIDPESRIVMARIRKLGELHAEGLLTDEEFSAKKAELLERL